MIIEAHSHWKHFQSRFPEWLNAGVLCAWGLYLLAHPGMFEDTRVAPLWTGLDYYATQTTWGVVAFTVGLLRLIALYINGHHQRTPMVRLVASFFSAFIWTQVLTGMINSGVPNTGIVLYAGLVIADIYSTFRASEDVTFVARRAQAVKAELSRVARSLGHS